MKLSEYKKTSTAYTSKASDITRQLALGGLAIIWFFKDGKIIDARLLIPLITLPLALMADLAQYVIGGYTWNGFFVRNEKEAIKNQQVDPDIKAPRNLNRPIYIFYWIKIILVLISYLLIINFLLTQIEFK